MIPSVILSNDGIELIVYGRHFIIKPEMYDSSDSDDIPRLLGIQVTTNSKDQLFILPRNNSTVEIY